MAVWVSVIVLNMVVTLSVAVVIVLSKVIGGVSVRYVILLISGGGPVLVIIGVFILVGLVWTSVPFEALI